MKKQLGSTSFHDTVCCPSSSLMAMSSLYWPSQVQVGNDKFMLVKSTSCWPSQVQEVLAWQECQVALYLPSQVLYWSSQVQVGKNQSKSCCLLWAVNHIICLLLEILKQQGNEESRCFWFGFDTATAGCKKEEHQPKSECLMWHPYQRIDWLETIWMVSHSILRFSTQPYRKSWTINRHSMEEYDGRTSINATRYLKLK